jgi:hypothetical protein
VCKIVGTPAVSQKHRDRQQPWVLAGRQTRHTADEHVEVVADVEFFEQQVQQARVQRETAGRFRQLTENGHAAESSPVGDLNTSGYPDRLLLIRDSSACGSIAHGRHLRLSARL